MLATTDLISTKMGQQDSRLLLLPTELRHEIFQYLVPSEVHLRWLDRGYVFSECLRPPAPKDDKDMMMGSVTRELYELYGSSRDLDQTVLTRRVQSPWGCHCKCEEVAMGENNDGRDPYTAPLLVCKTM
jgi:hypothetical protein